MITRAEKLFAPVMDNVGGNLIKSHQLMLHAGMIKRLSNGLFSLLPLGTKALKNVMDVVDQVMSLHDCQKMDMPTLLPSTLWETSGRWSQMGEEMFRLQDRRGVDHCLAPTHEEAFCATVGRLSYRQLPLKLYQMGHKFRDEVRPRFGLMRGREFLMKDAYTFDLTQEDSLSTYYDMLRAYHEIAAQLELPCVAAAADTGLMGGSLSHEFQVLSDVGEDTVHVCSEACGWVANSEASGDVHERCPECAVGEKRIKRGIEIGHAFLLGTKYSSAMGVLVKNQQGVSVPAEMGCYGIGVSRALAAIVQVHSEGGALVFPKRIAPWPVLVASLVKHVDPIAERIAKRFSERGVDVLLDTSSARVGGKFSRAERFGVPVVVAVGNRWSERNVVEIHDRGGGGVREVGEEGVVEAVM